MSNKMIFNAISAVLALGITSANAAETQNTGENMMQGPALPGMERCFGIVKAGLNDCGNTSHHCSGEAKVDRDKNEWIYLPSGLCKRIAGGNTPTKS